MPPKKRTVMSTNRVKMRMRRASETPEQRAVRLENARIRSRISRALETPEQRAARLERGRIWSRSQCRRKKARALERHLWLESQQLKQTCTVQRTARQEELEYARLRAASKRAVGNFRRKKPSPSAAQPSVSSLEPEVVIKEEPIDIDEDPVPSTSGTVQEFILPCTDSFQSNSTPTVGEAFTVVKTEPVDEDELQTNSNDNTTKASKRKAAEMADVGQSECPAYKSDEDSATKNSNAKDHFDVYGEYIAAKLRKLDWKSCAYVQKAFGDILFDAEMGKFK